MTQQELRPNGLLSEGADVTQLHIEGSLTMPTQGLKGYNDGNAEKSFVLKYWGREHGAHLTELGALYTQQAYGCKYRGRLLNNTRVFPQTYQ